MAVRILYNLDDINGATLVASSTYNSDFPVGNVINNQIGRPWRSNTPITNPETVAVDLLSAKSLTCAGIFGHNFSAAAVVKLQRSADNTNWTDVGTFTIATNADSVVLPRTCLFFSSISYRYWRIHMVDTANTDLYLQIGRLALGAYYEPDRNYTDGYSVEVIDPSEQQRTAGTQPIFAQKDPYRRVNLSFEYMDDTQRRKLLAMFSKVRTTEPMMIALDPTNATAAVIVEEMLWGSFITPMRLVTALVNQHDAVSVVIEERL